MEEERE
jgi:hypothetical protein